MIYSKTCEYAIRSLTYLAAKPREAKTRIPEVFRSTGVPGPYIAKIFQSLAAAGILKSYRGACGGFSFQKDPGKISIMEIIVAIDSLEPWKECVMGLDQCSDRNACPAHDIWKHAKQKMIRKFERTKLINVNKKSAKIHYRKLRRARLNILRK